VHSLASAIGEHAHMRPQRWRQIWRIAALRGIMPAMLQPRSIRSHLAIVFLFFFLLVIVLGLFSLSRLSNFNKVSEDIAALWLPNTRVLGDLNNFTSDFRAVEGSNLLADPSEIAATEKEIVELDRSIAQAERNYEQIRHDP